MTGARGAPRRACHFPRSAHAALDGGDGPLGKLLAAIWRGDEEGARCLSPSGFYIGISTPAQHTAGEKPRAFDAYLKSSNATLPRFARCDCRRLY